MVIVYLFSDTSLAKQPGIPSVAALIHQYSNEMEYGGIDHWSFHVAFAFFRRVAILAGVYKRFTLGRKGPKCHEWKFAVLKCCLIASCCFWIRINSSQG